MPHTITSIDFISNGEEWTATVGQKLTGVKRETRMVNGNGIERTHRKEDEATVVAITLMDNGVSQVATDARPHGEVISAWANPFLAGVPTSIRYAEDKPA